MSSPSFAAQRALSLKICCWTLAVCWFYQGLIPKILGPDVIELRFMHFLFGPGPTGAWVARAIGVLECLFALWLLFSRAPRLPLRLNILAMPGLLLSAAWVAPDTLRSAFNPVALNLAMAGLGWVALLQLQDKCELA